MLEIGSSLREARDRLGLELSEVEAATMIPGRYLEALEHERFELLPPGLYRRSFLRKYAEFLGLDGDTYVAEFELRFAPPEPEPPGPTAGLGVFSARLLAGVSVRRVVFLAAVVLVGVGVWQLGTGGTGTPTAVTTREQTTRSRAHAQPAVPSHRPARVVPARSTGPPPTLTLTARRGSCWLSVHLGSNAGPVVYQQTLQEGQKVRFGLRQRLWIRLGAPWNIDAVIGRRTVTSALPSSTGDTLATAAGLRPAP